MKQYHTISQKNLYRPRISNLFDESLSFPLICIDAGAGFGKSIAIKQYIHNSEINHTVIRLNQFDNIPEQFWTKYISALNETNQQLAEELKEAGFPFSTSDINHCQLLFMKHLDFDDDFCFVIDGFHVITEPSILRFLEGVIFTEIEFFHTVLISSNRHFLNLSAFYQAGLVFHISEQELLFSKKEIGDYFLLLGMEQDTALIDWVYEFSEGWAFAVKTAVCTLRNNVSKKSMQTEVLPTLFELMQVFTFDSYDPPQQEALISLSFLHTIPVQLVMNITDLDYNDLLYLVERNPFIRHDVNFGTIEMHKIYQKFLQTKHILFSKEKVLALQLKIADWYYQNGHVYEAMDFYKQCGSYAKICEIIRCFKNKKLSYDTSSYLLQIMNEVPRDIIALYHDMPLYQAMFLFNNCQLEDARSVLSLFEKSLLSRNQTEAIVKLLGETYLLLGLIRLFQRESDFEHFFIMADQNLQNGSSFFDRTYPLLEINHSLTTKGLNNADIENGLSVLKSGFPIFIKLTHGCGAGLIDLAFGECQFLKGNLASAEKHLYQGLFQAQEHKQGDIVLSIYFILLRVAIAQGKPQKALVYVDKIRNFNKNPSYPKRSYPLVDIVHGWISLKVGTPARIASWLRSDEINPNDISKLNAGRNHTLHANWLLTVKNNPAEALAYLEKITEVFCERNLTTPLVYTCLLKYTAYRMLEKPDADCFALIEQVYDYIEEADLYMFVVESGSAVRTALRGYRKYPHRKIPDEWTDRIITKATTYSKYFNSFKLEYQKSINYLPDIPLTESEQVLMDGLCHGLSRTEIAEENNISENTVKSQLKTIYNKLDATNYAEAVYIYTFLRLS